MRHPVEQSGEPFVGQAAAEE
ncbi:MAG: hypothetical protein QOI36_4271, partial [Pseudonocardiales bacterium]|nr:hypothetical protein [Pseudonocardiales bacterium]